MFLDLKKFKSKNMQKLLLIALSFIFITAANSQNTKCVTTETWKKYQEKNPSAEARKQELEKFTKKWIEGKQTKINGQVISIPVVVHVIYYYDEDNISDEQIYSQIDVLNEDFRLLNSDSLDENHPFWFNTADSEIEFCLANVDPFGNLTDGITRTYTDSVEFIDRDNLKFSASGGEDNWDPNSYLNFWVFPLSNGLLGYATFPSDLNANPELDGVVVSTSAFGTFGNLNPSNNLGRTATHEVGHWLNLRHIWGDDFCGDDFVGDTKPAEEANYNCPSFPHRDFNSCGTNENGEMFMNYMDYVDDACMNMFTFGQVDRMWATLSSSRVDLLSSIGCDDVSDIQEFTSNNFKLYPNPNCGQFTIEFIEKTSNLEILDILGKQVFFLKDNNELSVKIDLTSKIKSGTYFIRSLDSKNNKLHKLVIK
ncbi:MAG: T9SS type A sorting domain-containing protein [Flavobacteriales bacterium]|nr:T9SS type A sorting domain-containing protein [Flavobacteriales bacterium]